MPRDICVSQSIAYGPRTRRRRRSPFNFKQNEFIGKYDDIAV